MANVIEITVKGNDKASGEFKKTTTAANGFRDSLKRIGETAAGFLAAQLFTGGLQRAADFFQSSTRAASDLGEALSKSNTVFGSQASAIEAFASSAAQNLGLSKRAALDAAGGFGNMFDQLGIGVDRSSAMSQSMIMLASDFASFHNADISEVLEAQSAAFRGEYDSLQQFLPLIQQATVDQKALELSGKSATSELTAQDKALAVYAMMVEGAGQAAGDFARTSEGLANQERITAAEMENVSAEIGSKLLPIQLKLNQAKLALATAIADRVVPWLETMASTIRDNVGPVMETLREHSDLVIGALAGIGAVLLGVVVPGLVASAAASIAAAAPWVALAAAGAAIGAALVWAYNNIQPFHDAVDKVASFLKTTAIEAWNVFVDVIQDLPENLAEIKDRLVEFKDNLVETWDTIATNTEGLRSRLGETWTSIVDSVVDMGDRIVEVWNSLRDRVVEIVSGIVESVQQFWADNGEQIIETIISLKDGIVEAWNTIKDEVLEIVGIVVDEIQQFWADNGEQIASDLVKLKDDFVEAWNGIYEAVAPVIEQIATIITAVMTVIVTVVGAILLTIIELWQRYGDNVMQVVTAVWEAVKGIFTAALEFLLSTVAVAWDLIVGVISGALDIITGLFQIVSAIWTGDWSMLWEGIKNIVSGAWEIITTIITAAWDLIIAILKLGMSVLLELFKLGWEAIKAVISLAWELIVTIVTQSWDAIVTVSTTILGVLLSLITAGWDAIKSAISAAWEAIKSLVSAAWEALKSGASSSIDAIKGTISSGMESIKSTISSAWESIKSIVSSAWDSIKSTVSDAASSIKGSLSGLWDNITSGLAGKVSSAIGLINSLINAYNRIPGVPDISTISVGSKGGGSPRSSGGRRPPNVRAAGGITSGMTLFAEAGRELLSLPGGGMMMALPNGTMVHSNADTEQMLARGGTGGLTVNIYAQGSILAERDIRSIVLDTVRTVGLDSYGLRGAAR